MGIIYTTLYQKYNKSVLNAAEVAEELGITVATLKRRIKAKKVITPLVAGTGSPLQFNLCDIAKFLGDTDL